MPPTPRSLGCDERAEHVIRGGAGDGRVPRDRRGRRARTCRGRRDEEQRVTRGRCGRGPGHGAEVAHPQGEDEPGEQGCRDAPRDARTRERTGEERARGHGVSLAFRAAAWQARSPIVESARRTGPCAGVGDGSGRPPGVGFTSAVSCGRPCAVPRTPTPRIAVGRFSGPAPTLGPVPAVLLERTSARVLVGPGSPPSWCQGPPDRAGRQPSRNRPADRPRVKRGVPRLPQKGTSCPS